MSKHSFLVIFTVSSGSIYTYYDAAEYLRVKLVQTPFEEFRFLSEPKYLLKGNVKCSTGQQHVFLVAFRMGARTRGQAEKRLTELLNRTNFLREDMGHRPDGKRITLKQLFTTHSLLKGKPRELFKHRGYQAFAEYDELERGLRVRFADGLHGTMFWLRSDKIKGEVAPWIKEWDHSIREHNDDGPRAVVTLVKLSVSNKTIYAVYVDDMSQYGALDNIQNGPNGIYLSRYLVYRNRVYHADDPTARILKNAVRLKIDPDIVPLLLEVQTVGH